VSGDLDATLAMHDELLARRGVDVWVGPQGLVQLLVDSAGNSHPFIDSPALVDDLEDF
jgi:hypothetical protein